MTNVRKSKCSSCGRCAVVQFDNSIFCLEEAGKYMEVPYCFWQECLACGVIKHRDMQAFATKLCLLRQAAPAAVSRLLLQYFRQLPLMWLEKLAVGARLDAVVAAHVSDELLRIVDSLYVRMPGNRVVPNYSTDAAALGELLQQLLRRWPGVRLLLTVEKLHEGLVPAANASKCADGSGTTLVVLVDKELARYSRGISVCASSLCAALCHASIIYARHRFMRGSSQLGDSMAPEMWDALRTRGIRTLHSYAVQLIYNALTAGALPGYVVEKSGAISLQAGNQENCSLAALL